MEKKSTIISLIFIGVIVVATILTITMSGITAKDYNYVQIEVNPRIELILDRKNKVISVSPLNDDARIVLAGLDIIDQNIDDAIELYLDECSKTGYIDMNGVDNATNITVVDGLTQALDVHVMQDVYNYFRKNEILSAITENYEIREMFNKKRENNICCANKFKLISTMHEKNPNLSISTLKNMSEVNLIDLVAEEHKNNPYTPTEEEITRKQTLINNNQKKYLLHTNSISNRSQKEFNKLFNEFQKYSTKEYHQDFSKQYTSWQNNKQ